MSMARVATAAQPAPATTVSATKCAECGSADVGTARRFPANERMGATFVCPKCAAISVMDMSKARMLRTHEWSALLLLPFGYDLLELRLEVAKKLGLA
jgi:predicted RNA-binding Zn-ribbon protein involved in translation (DUF1610 family)